MVAQAQRYSIYVIELPEAAAKDAKLLSSSPKRDQRKPCLYVGHTAKSVPERFEDHRLKRAATVADITRKYGVVRLRPDLANGKYAYSREKALAVERKLAESLRRRGYGVWQA